MNVRRFQKSAVKLWRRLQMRLGGGRKVLVLGDSHCGGLEYCFDHGLLTPHWLNCEIVGGATAYGLGNDRSATQAWQKFSRALQRFADFGVVMILLGECDCSYALWKIAKRRNVSPGSLIEHSMYGVRRLVKRIRDDANGGAKAIVLIGAPLPTVDDSNILAQDNAMRREVTASQVERTRLVLRFNGALLALAGELGVAYFDLTAQTLDPQTGVVDRRFVADALDHHLSQEAMAPLWSAALSKWV